MNPIRYPQGCSQTELEKSYRAHIFYRFAPIHLYYLRYKAETGQQGCYYSDKNPLHILCSKLTLFESNCVVTNVALEPDLGKSIQTTAVS